MTDRSRNGGTGTVVVVLNAGTGARTVSLNVSGVGLSNGTVMTDALGSAVISTVTSGTLALTVPGQTVLILVPD